MTFEELVKQLPVNGRGVRVTWGYQYYVQKDPDGITRLKNTLEPELPGVDWSKRTGYDRKATDYIVLTGQMYTPRVESIAKYWGEETAISTMVMLGRTLGYVLQVSLDSIGSPQLWDIVPTRDHKLNIVRHPAHAHSTPVSSVDISRLRANKIGH